MVNHQTHGRTRGRKIIAAAMLSLLVLRGLSFLAIAGAFLESSSVANPVLSTLDLGEHCDWTEGQSDHQTPNQDCSDCCVFCASAARDLIVPGALSFKATDALFSSAVVSLSTFYRDKLGAPRPPGLIANWSATSPPRIS
jgi:hypothetical protein